MKLSSLLDGVTVTKLFQTMYGNMAVTHDVVVHSVQYDSRRVAASDVFVAIRGAASDGHAFVEAAIGRGAKVVVVERDDAVPDPLCMHQGVIKVVVSDTRKALAVMAANQFGHPSRAMRLVGVTGTNGKTTTSHLMRSVLEASGVRTGLIGTIEYRFGERIVPATHTTPESLELNELLAAMRDDGCRAVSMEVSSHALDQSRVHGMAFDAALFTNLTQDHLDYHGTMDRYFLAKKILFDGLRPEAAAVVNADDAYGARIIADTNARRFSYSIDAASTYRALNIAMDVHGTRFSVDDPEGRTEIETPLIGRFNVLNVLAAYAAGRALGFDRATVVKGIAAVPSVRGRFEQIASPAGWTAILDYAHTPDALENCLRTIRGLMPPGGPGRVITVFGAGGDRDRTKRPLMGAVVAKYSDVVVVTSDNPRTEDPGSIIDEVLAGIRGHANVIRESDRRAAIATALGQAKAGDVVLVAGKGHEEYQVIGKERMPFSDREVIEEQIR